MLGLLMIVIVVWAILSAIMHSEYCQDTIIYRSDGASLPPRMEEGGDVWILYGDNANDNYSKLSRLTVYQSPLDEEEALQYYDDVQELGYTNISVIGYKQGAYTAAYIASRRSVDRLVLHDPFMSAEDAVRNYGTAFIKFIPGRPGHGRKLVSKLLKKVKADIHHIGREPIGVGEHYSTHFDSFGSKCAEAYETMMGSQDS